MVEYDIMKMQGGVSMLYEYLLDTFGTNEPISVSDITVSYTHLTLPTTPYV